MESIVPISQNVHTLVGGTNGANEANTNFSSCESLCGRHPEKYAKGFINGVEAAGHGPRWMWAAAAAFASEHVMPRPSCPA